VKAIKKRAEDPRKSTAQRLRKGIASLVAGSVVLALLVASAGAKPKNKTAAPKRDALADYVQRMMGAAPAAAAGTPGSLWIDNGRLANMVADYASSQVDKRKVGKLALAIQVAFQEMGVFPASTTQIPLNMDEPMPFSTVQAIQNVKRNAELGRIASHPEDALAAASEESDLATLQRELSQALHNEMALHEVAMHRETDGLVVSLREFGFFDSGSAAIKQESLPALARIASILAIRNYRLRVEGHTDNIPIHNSQMASNWELSTARATVVIKFLIIDQRFAPERLSAAGYAEFHPVASNLTPQGRAQNRRVDIVILSATVALPASTAEDDSPAQSEASQ
jgi:chemotaxis protein MotB